MGKANEKQVAGTHYKGAIQPWDVVNDWGLGYLDGTALKYIARWRKKNGLEDIKKAIHFLEKLVEHEQETKQQEFLQASKLVGQAYSNFGTDFDTENLRYKTRERWKGLLDSPDGHVAHQNNPIGDAFPYHMALEQVQRDWVLEAEKQEKILKALAEDAEALGLHNDVP